MSMIEHVPCDAYESLPRMAEQDNCLLNLDEIDFSLLRLNSSPVNLPELPFRSSITVSSAAGNSDEIAMKRHSPDLNLSDKPKRRKIFVQKKDSMSPPVFSDYSKNPSSSDPTHTRSRLAPALQRSLFHECSSPVRQETTPFSSKRSSEKKAEEKEEEHSEKESNEGMRVERSGDGYVIRLKCRCRQAYRVLFYDRHFYFKLL